MDLVGILSDAIERLPAGDHSEGLSAILRHIVAAVRHFSRDVVVDPDCHTDAIYRTNQAYEGSLKEAYRVLAGKDPAGLRTYDIEQYLEGEGLLRSRVLTQLARYRQDYRNPSTHDYRLDFDRAEALLAIVSVCAFATLLIDQISTKLTSEKVRSQLTEKTLPKSFSIEQKTSFIAENLLKRFDVIEDIKFDNEMLGSVAGVLESFGLNVETTEQEDSLWDIRATSGDFALGVEIRLHFLSEDGLPDHSRMSYLSEAITEVQGGVLVQYSLEYGLTYNLFSALLRGSPFFVITPDPSINIPGIQKDLADVCLVKSRKMKAPTNGVADTL